MLQLSQKRFTRYQRSTWNRDHFERAKPISKILPVSWAETILTKMSKSFQRGTVSLCRLNGCKATIPQTVNCPESNPGYPCVLPLRPGGRFFFQTSKFDSLQFCSQLTYRDLQYLFGKISTSLTYWVSIWRTSRILIQVMLCQNDLIYIGLML